MHRPTLSGLNAPTFLENTVNAVPQVIDADVTLTNPDNYFNLGTLVVSGLLPVETVGIKNGAVIYASAGTVYYDLDGEGLPFAVGTTSGGGGSTFTVTFNGLATTAIVELVIESLTYANSSDTPTASNTLTIDVTNGAGENLGGAPEYTLRAGALSPVNAINNTLGLYPAPVLVDLNNDGLLDLVFGRYAGDFRYYENTGTASAPVFTAMTGGSNPFNGLTVGNFEISSTPTLIDIDNDGDLDMVSGGGGGDLHLYENTGSVSTPAFSEVFGAGNPFTTFNAAYNGAGADSRDNYVTFGDVDNDGDLDAFVGPNDGTIHFLLNATVPVRASVWASATDWDR